MTLEQGLFHRKQRKKTHCDKFLTFATIFFQRITLTTGFIVNRIAFALTKIEALEGLYFFYLVKAQHRFIIIMKIVSYTTLLSFFLYRYCRMSLHYLLGMGGGLLHLLVRFGAVHYFGAILLCNYWNKSKPIVFYWLFLERIILGSNSSQIIGWIISWIYL